MNSYGNRHRLDDEAMRFAVDLSYAAVADNVGPKELGEWCANLGASPDIADEVWDRVSDYHSNAFDDLSPADYQFNA